MDGANVCHVRDILSVIDAAPKEKEDATSSRQAHPLMYDSTIPLLEVAIIRKSKISRKKTRDPLDFLSEVGYNDTVLIENAC